jgi:hypothetical protein
VDAGGKVGGRVPVGPIVGVLLGDGVLVRVGWWVGVARVGVNVGALVGSLVIEGLGAMVAVEVLVGSGLGVPVAVGNTVG